MDVLADVLNSMRLSGEIFCRSELTAPWGLRMPALDGAVFHVVDRGNAWLKVADDTDLIPLAGGDLIVFPQSCSHAILDSPSSSLIGIEQLVELRGEDSYTLSYGGGGPPTTLICGVFKVQDGGEHTLFSLLPPLIHIKGEQGRAVEWLETTLRFMSAEAGSTSPGAKTIVGHLTEILFIQAVRSWINSHPDSVKGWLTALNDQQIGEALGHIHGKPDQPWTVESMGAEVGMSRSSFAAKFSELVGDPPLQYLTRWRMQLASSWLLDSDLNLSEIAERIGYQSEDPFKRAFKKHTGTPPGAYRRRGRVRAGVL